MTGFSHELDIASDLARKAGKIIMTLYQENFSVMYKGVNDPITKADQLANSIIVEGLHAYFPQDCIVSEESLLPSTDVTKGRVWYVDPLDGTKEFISHNGEFTTMIGLTIDGEPKLGVVFWPTRGNLYAGLTNQTAWVESNGIRHRLEISRSKNPPHIFLITSRSHRSPILSTIRKSLPIQHEQQMGSVGLKIGQIAQGKADLYIDPGPFTKSWDACAPEAILRGAGGYFTDIHGKPIQYGLNNYCNLHGLVGSTKDCHQRVIQALTSLCASCEG